MKSAVIALCLAGCVTLTPESQQYVKAFEVKATRVEWVRTNNVNAVCQGMQPRNNFLYVACTQHAPDYSWCKIYAPEEAITWILGDELKHCFGYDHPQ